MVCNNGKTGEAAKVGRQRWKPLLCFTVSHVQQAGVPVRECAKWLNFADNNHAERAKNMHASIIPLVDVKQHQHTIECLLLDHIFHLTLRDYCQQASANLTKFGLESPLHVLVASCLPRL